MVTETPHKYKNLKEAYDSMKAQYNSDYHYDIINLRIKMRYGFIK